MMSLRQIRTPLSQWLQCVAWQRESTAQSCSGLSCAPPFWYAAWKQRQGGSGLFRLTASNRLILDVALALVLAPLALACVAGLASLRRVAARSAAEEHRRVGARLMLCALSVSLASAFVLPRFSTDRPVENRAELLGLARTAQLSGGGILSLDAVVVTARQRPDLRDLAELLALANSGSARLKSALPDALFAGGHRLQSAQTPLVTFEGWAAHDLGDGHCEVIAYFRPSVAISGQQVWIHEYPENSHVYSDVSRAMPPGQWAPGELGWEVFRPLQTERFILYACTERDGDLGPAVLFGRVQTCRRPSS